MTSNPQPIIEQALFNLNKGKLKAAETMSNLLIELHPENNEVLLLAAEIKLQKSEELEQGLNLVAQALITSTSSTAFSNLANRLYKAKKLDAADKVIKVLIHKWPNSYDLLNLSGIVLREKKCLPEAIEACKKATALEKNIDRAWLNLGIAYLLYQKNEDALEAFTNAVNIKTTGFSLHLQAAAQIKLLEHEVAREILEKALLYSPGDHNIIIDICATYYNLSDHDPALAVITDALSKNPSNLELLKTKAVVLRQMGKAYEAIKILEDVLRQQPNDLKSWIFLGNAYYHALGKGTKAKECYDNAYKIDPNNPEIIEKLCTFLQETREGVVGTNIVTSHALACKLISITPDPLTIAGAIQPSILTALDYETHDKLGSREKLISTYIGGFQMSRIKTMEDRLSFVEAHRKWGKSAEEGAQKKPITRRVRQRLNNKVRLGILSSDLRHHPVGYFTWPIAEHLNKDRFELYCYSAFPYDADATQKAFSEKSDSFRVFREESTHEIAQSIADDGLDIMFELGGRTLYNRLEVCAYKPAPIQVSWLGYPHSIGMPTAIDYILVDPYLKPEDPRLLIEKPFIVPETWVSLDKVGFLPTPITDTIPEDINGYITFGTLNAAHKFNPETFATWAEIMHRVPNSRFLYVRLEADAEILRNNFCKHMAKHGISSDRISFKATNEHHLQFYNKIDIALDTFPHTGGTTTCETLWMGVPPVTLVGPSMFERLSYSNIVNAGLPDLCAFTLEEYKNIAVKLAQDVERRRYLRRNLRQQIMKNPLGQPKRFVEGFCNTIYEVLGRK